MKNFSLSLFVLFLISNLSFAQQKDARYPQGQKTVSFGVIETINSKYLSEERVLNIYLPQGYDPDSAATYPTIYLLDGSAHEDYPHVAGLAQFMNMYQLLPHSIVVGIANVDRYRDFTFPSQDSLDNYHLPQSGGAEKFLDFMEKELQPMINQKFKTNGSDAIIGQSLGGLLATEILMKRPDMFEDYIIVSPSLWWNKQKLVKTAGKYFKDNQQLEKRIVVSIGTEHPEMFEVANALVYAIQESGNKKLTLFFEPLPRENHATVLHRAVYRAFELLNPKKDKK